MTDRCLTGRAGAQASLSPSTRPKDVLSAREREVLHWLAIGKSGVEVGLILGISTCTVRLHIQSIKRKLCASNIPHAVARGYDTGVFAASIDRMNRSPSRQSAAAKGASSS